MPTIKTCNTAPVTAQQMQQTSKRNNAQDMGVLGAAVVLGVGSCFVFNHLNTPASRRTSLARYAIALLPATLYLGGWALRSMTDKPSRQLNDRNPVLPPRRTVAPHHAARLAQQGYKDLSPIQVAAWLKNTDCVEFSDEELEAAAQTLTDQGVLPGLVTAARQAHWRTLPLPGSVSFTCPATAGSTASAPPGTRFHALVKKDCNYEQFFIPLAQLKVSDVMVALMDTTVPVPDENNACLLEQSKWAVALERRTEKTFRFFDAEGELSSIPRSQIWFLVWALTTLPLKTDVTMIQLRKEPNGKDGKTGGQP
ncbi:MAG: hypothetical protein OXC07_13330 [Kistimonas sp.]|nr:hypothetical protein [Kistimonas sp.]